MHLGGMNAVTFCHADWPLDRQKTPMATASVEALDLSTMRWSAAGCMPPLPDPRGHHTAVSSSVGRRWCVDNDGGNVPPGYEMGHLTEQDGAAVGAREV
jgi:hypothetical protein